MRKKVKKSKKKGKKEEKEYSSWGKQIIKKKAVDSVLKNHKPFFINIGCSAVLFLLSQ